MHVLLTCMEKLYGDLYQEAFKSCGARAGRHDIGPGVYGAQQARDHGRVLMTLKPHMVQEGDQDTVTPGQGHGHPRTGIY